MNRNLVGEGVTMQQATISNSATSRLSRNQLNDILQRGGL
jgi:hypothetical protein